MKALLVWQNVPESIDWFVLTDPTEDDLAILTLAHGMTLIASDEAKANARLIAAAPELLEFVIRLVGDDFLSETEANRARKLLAKVVGY